MTSYSCTRSSLQIGNLNLSSPIVLAPMAGVTNAPFRRLCRELETTLTGTTAGLYVCEMITARALIEKNPKTLAMTRFHSSENPRSLQLYTVDPRTTFAAVQMIVAENLADHIDLNFGCPVPKVTRKGGGAALPFKRHLFAAIIAQAVAAARHTHIPITVKMRMGIDDQHLTYREAGKIAENEGASAITLHARTAAQLYSGKADWNAIGELKSLITTIPVLGNGDVYTARDAQRMQETTGCDGIVIGRGCLGRPWLFAEISHYFRHHSELVAPDLTHVGTIMYRHACLLADHLGEKYGIKDMRKHTGWYLRGFPVGGQLRAEFSVIQSLSHLEDLIQQLPQSPFPAEGYTMRGRKGHAAKVHLPQGWLDDPWDDTVPVGAEIDNSGG